MSSRPFPTASSCPRAGDLQSKRFPLIQDGRVLYFGLLIKDMQHLPASLPRLAVSEPGRTSKGRRQT